MEKLFSDYPEIKQEEIQKAMDFSCKQILYVLPKFHNKFQNAYSVNGFYEPIENTDWTNGFWTGQIWLAYEYCQEEILEKEGSLQIISFLDRINNKINVEHHDMGFLYSLSCVAGYKLKGIEAGKEAAIKAAEQLIGRFQQVGEFIQAWGRMDEPGDYRLIIDCLLNLPLLYWATEETGNVKYKEIADMHINTAVANVIREDYSTWHTFYFDPLTGKPHHGATCQGYRDGSAWTRGQAWGIYGMALAYKYTGRREYIDIFKKITTYFLEHLPKDLIPYWDLEFSDGSKEPRDSSSTAIVACGLLEMANYLEEEEAMYYSGLARKFMKVLFDYYRVTDVEKSNGLILHGTYSKRSPYNTCNHYGVDECLSWGDYFYMEALTRMLRKWNPYW